MLVSFVVRLSPSSLCDGRLVGEVEHVATGERGQFRDVAELTTWCARVAAAPVDLPEPRQVVAWPIAPPHQR